MPLSDSEIRSFQATDKREKASCGDSLYLVVEHVQKGGGKSFIAKTRFPPGRQGKWVEAQQLRAAANAPIQGSSADIIKVAMVQLQDALQQQGLPAQLLLQVHDELVLEVAPDALEATRELVVKTMEHAVKLSVPLVAETGAGANWMEAK